MKKNKFKTISMVLLILVSFWLIADDIFLALNKATDINFSERSKEENAARILKWNLNKCPKIINLHGK
ncbi:hypothetical protein [Coleofasciculus sp. E1-EBD-02]|jgi:hypothetical protein|uniref:hypothetical protein n=1 Tax=Coleofasciculus sp. E1-EBD-02 TaxID=3068481 RepID=UPI0032FABF45